MATDEELTTKLKEFLRESDLSTTTTGSVRRHLEAVFGTDLTHKKAFIREQVDLFLSTELNANGEDEAEQEGERDGEGEGEGGEGGSDNGEEEGEEDEEDDGEEEQEGSGRKKRRTELENTKISPVFTTATDEELTTKLKEFLRGSDLSTTSTNSVCRHLEAEFGMDILHKKALICEQIDLFFRTELNINREDEAETQGQREEGGEGGERGSDEEEDKEASGTSGRKQRRTNLQNIKISPVITTATDEEITAKLKEFIRGSDLSTATTGSVFRHLEEEFGTDLSHKKAFIREQVVLFLRTVLNANGEDEAGLEGEIEEGDGGEGGSKNGEEEGEDGEDDDEEQEASGNSGRMKRRLNKSSNKEGKKRAAGGFTKLCSLSADLQELVGESTLARTEVVKRLWAYIREKDLQDPKDRRKIICDERLKKLFNVNAIGMFQMNKALKKHIWSLEDGDISYAVGTSSKSKEKEKPQKKDKKSEGKKTGPTGLMMPLKLSEELVNFLGTGETSLARSAVIKHIWDYIKENNLQDPSDRRNILCDQKLKELMQVDSFNGFSMAKLLKPHFIKE